MNYDDVRGTFPPDPSVSRLVQSKPTLTDDQLNAVADRLAVLLKERMVLMAYGCTAAVDVVNARVSEVHRILGALGVRGLEFSQVERAAQLQAYGPED